MNTLLVDIGNSRIKWALARGPRIGRQTRAAELGRVRRRFERMAAQTPGFDAVQAVCVAGRRVEAPAARRTSARHRAPPPTFARSTAAGRRRHEWLSRDLAPRAPTAGSRAIGAWHEAGAQRAVCAVAVGTALTIDVVDADGTSPRRTDRTRSRAHGALAAGRARTASRRVRQRVAFAPRGRARLLIRPLADNTRDAIGLGSLTAARRADRPLCRAMRKRFAGACGR